MAKALSITLDELQLIINLQRGGKMAYHVGHQEQKIAKEVKKNQSTVPATTNDVRRYLENKLVAAKKKRTEYIEYQS